ncbi:hypothetical protein B0H10DRAFT_2112241 [Mycena sp. CBHHK59/15]|nr:hypothetical protein B0H10DRAFT_2112241 [Mycena sp. CBHHK59/15]
MSSTTSTKLGDDFLRIAKLEVTGKNWAVDARGFAEHLDANAAPLPHSTKGTGCGVEERTKNMASGRGDCQATDRPDLCKGQGDLGEIQRPIQSPPKAL